MKKVNMNSLGEEPLLAEDSLPQNAPSINKLNLSIESPKNFILKSSSQSKQENYSV